MLLHIDAIVIQGRSGATGRRFPRCGPSRPVWRGRGGPL